MDISIHIPPDELGAALGCVIGTIETAYGEHLRGQIVRGIEKAVKEVGRDTDGKEQKTGTDSETA